MKTLLTKAGWSLLFYVFFFGYLGVHRFYAGRIVSGIFMILTLGGLGIWTFVDFVVILCGSFKDSKGRHIYEWLD